MIILELYYFFKIHVIGRTKEIFSIHFPQVFINNGLPTAYK